MSLVPSGDLEEVREFCEVMMRVARMPEWRMLMQRIEAVMEDNSNQSKTAALDRGIDFEKLAHITIQCASRNEALESVKNLPQDAHGALQRILARTKRD